MDDHDEFAAIVAPVIMWLAENGDPHSMILIDAGGAELVQGRMSVVVSEFLND